MLIIGVTIWLHKRKHRSYSYSSHILFYYQLLYKGANLLKLEDGKRSQTSNFSTGNWISGTLPWKQMKRDKSEPNYLLELPQQALDFNFCHLWAQNANVQSFYDTITTCWSFTCVWFGKIINSSCWQMMVWVHLTGRWEKKRGHLKDMKKKEWKVELNLLTWRNRADNGGMMGARGRKRGGGTERWEEPTVLHLNSILLVSSFGITV